MGSGVAAEAGGWDANNSGVRLEGLRSLGNAKRCAVEVKARWGGRRVPGSRGAEMKCTRRRGRNVEAATKKSGRWVSSVPERKKSNVGNAYSGGEGAERGLIGAAVRPVAHAAAGVAAVRQLGGVAVRLGAREACGRSTLRREGRETMEASRIPGA